VKRYRVCVRGGTLESVSAAFEDLDVSSSSEGLIMDGLMTDQAALFGLLSRIREFGLALIWTETSDA
jgi:hypothetical protein